MKSSRSKAQYKPWHLLPNSMHSWTLLKVEHLPQHRTPHQKHLPRGPHHSLNQTPPPVMMKNKLRSSSPMKLYRRRHVLFIFFPFWFNNNFHKHFTHNYKCSTETGNYFSKTILQYVINNSLLSWIFYRSWCILENIPCPRRRIHWHGGKRMQHTIQHWQSWQSPCCVYPPHPRHQSVFFQQRVTSPQRRGQASALSMLICYMLTFLHCNHMLL